MAHWRAHHSRDDVQMLPGRWSSPPRPRRSGGGATHTPGLRAVQQEAPFELSDELTLPSGKTLRGSFARVYDLLRQSAARGYRHAIGVHQGPPGWVPAFLFREPWSGGNAGDRRFRTLRSEHGVNVMEQRFMVHGEVTATWIYKLSSVEPSAPAQFSRTKSSDPADEATLPAQSSRDEVTTPRRSRARMLRFYTHVGVPVAGRPDSISVTPGKGGPLAPPGLLNAKLVSGEWSQERAAEEYVSYLKRRYAARELAAILDREGDPVLWVEVGSPFDPLPTLERVLVACGATFLGVWTGRRESVAA